MFLIMFLLHFCVHVLAKIWFACYTVHPTDCCCSGITLWESWQTRPSWILLITINGWKSNANAYKPYNFTLI